MGLAEKIALLKNTYRSEGLAETMRVGWEGLRYLGETRKILFALSDPRPVPEAIAAAKTHRFEFASVEQLEALSRTPEYKIAAIDIERVKNRVARALLQLDGDTLVGYAWIWTHRLAFIEDGVHLNLPDDTIYNYKGYTNPAYRGYGFQALRHLRLLEMTRSEGVKRLFGFVDHFNTKSLKGVRKSGYVPVGELRIKYQDGQVKLTMSVESHFWSTQERT